MSAPVVRPLVLREVLPASASLPGVLVIASRCGFCSNPWITRPCPLVHAEVVIHQWQ